MGGGPSRIAALTCAVVIAPLQLRRALSSRSIWPSGRRTPSPSQRGGKTSLAGSGFSSRSAGDGLRAASTDAGRVQRGGDQAEAKSKSKATRIEFSRPSRASPTRRLQGQEILLYILPKSGYEFIKIILDRIISIVCSPLALRKEVRSTTVEDDSYATLSRSTQAQPHGSRWMSVSSGGGYVRDGQKFNFLPPPLL